MVVVQDKRVGNAHNKRREVLQPLIVQRVVEVVPSGLIGGTITVLVKSSGPKQFLPFANRDVPLRHRSASFLFGTLSASFWGGGSGIPASSGQ